MSYKFEDKLKDKSKNLIKKLSENGVKCDIDMIRDYLIKLDLTYKHEKLGKAKIYYKPSEEKFSLHLDELNTKKEIESFIENVWLSLENDFEFKNLEDIKIKAEPNIEYEIFTDGSCKKREDGTFKVGYGVAIYKEGELIDEINGLIKNSIYLGSRQIGGEIMGVIKAIKWCEENNIERVKISYDLALLEQWVKGKKAAKIPMAQEYVERIRYSDVEIYWNKVKGHTGVEGNELADDLAKKAVGVIENKKDNEKEMDLDKKIAININRESKTLKINYLKPDTALKIIELLSEEFDEIKFY